MNREGPSGAALRQDEPPLPNPILRLVRTALWRIPLSGVAGMATFALAGWLWQSHAPEQAAWATLAGWGVVTLSALAGLAGGVLLGLLGSMEHAVRTIEQAARTRLKPMTDPPNGEGMFRMSADELRTRIDEVANRVMDVTVGRLPMPAWLRRGVRTHLREALLSDFVADLERDGTGTVRFVDVRAWLLDKGLVMAINPVYVQLSWWRTLTLGLLGALALGLVVLWALGR